MSTGWIRTSHLEAQTSIHRDRDFSFPFVSLFIFIFFGYYTHMVMHSPGFRYIATYHRRLSGPPLSKGSFYGIRNEYFINIF